MNSIYSKRTTIKQICPKCGAMFTEDLQVYQHYIPRIWSLIQNKIRKCTICNMQMNLATVVCELDNITINGFRFDLIRNIIEVKRVKIDWVCVLCGNVVAYDERDFNDTKEMRDYITVRGKELEDKKACLCEKSLAKAPCIAPEYSITKIEKMMAVAPSKGV